MTQRPTGDTFSFGGGVQSTAALVLAAEGHIEFPTFLFANVGDDSEHPKTLRYVHDVAVPYAAEHGIELHLLQKVMRDGTPETLLGRITKPESRSIGIPVRMNRTGAPGNRQCTMDFKIRVLNRWHREHGYTAEEPAVCGLGISVDEIQRAKPSRVPTQRSVFPLLDLGLRRDDCRKVVASAGLPIPPKSACWFCPFHTLPGWRKMRRDEPDLFERVVDLETFINERSARLGRNEVFFASNMKPLPLAVGQGDQLGLDIDVEACDGGVCFT